MKPCVRGGAPQQADVTGAQENVTWAWGGICYIIECFYTYLYVSCCSLYVCLFYHGCSFFIFVYAGAKTSTMSMMAKLCGADGSWWYVLLCGFQTVSFFWKLLETPGHSGTVSPVDPCGLRRAYAFAKMQDAGASVGKTFFAGFGRPPMTMLHVQPVGPCDLRRTYMYMYVQWG
jgi:hypothetical protein